MRGIKRESLGRRIPRLGKNLHKKILGKNFPIATFNPRWFISCSLMGALMQFSASAMGPLEVSKEPQPLFPAHKALPTMHGQAKEKALKGLTEKKVSLFVIDKLLTAIARNVGQKAAFSVEVSGGRQPYHYTWQYRCGSGDFANIPQAKNAAHYTTPILDSEENGCQYRAIITDARRVRLITQPLTLQVNPSLTTTPPKDAIHDVGQKASFNTQPLGGTPAYHFQWQLKSKNDKEFHNVTAGEGKNAQLYTTDALKDAEQEDNSHYQVVVSDATGARVVSGSATLLVNKTLNIANQPESTMENIGQTALFNVTASGGTEPYQYQWQISLGGKEFMPVINETNASTYFTWPLVAEDAGNLYKVLITDAVGAVVESHPATLSIHQGLVAQTPSNAAVKAGESAIFSTQVSGASLAGCKFQWQIKALGSNQFVNLETESSSTNFYKIAKPSPADNQAQIRVIVIDAQTSQQFVSNSASLRVRPSLTTTAPLSQIRNAKQAVSFSTKPSYGKPRYYYQWQISHDQVNFDNIPQAHSISYTIPFLDEEDNGKYFRVEVRDASGERTQTAAALLTVHKALKVTNPRDIEVLKGERAEFVTEARFGSGPYRYQWYKKTKNDPDFYLLTKETTEKLIVTNPELRDDDSLYRVEVRDESNDSILSEAAHLSVHSSS